MTLIIDILNRVARECSVEAPDSWLGTTDDDHLALRDDFFVETVEEIVERADLPGMRLQTTITADGAKTGDGYDLPVFFARLQRSDTAVYETTPTRRVCTPVYHDGHWTHIQELGLAGISRFYRLVGYEGNWCIEFYNDIPENGAVKVSYITQSWGIKADGTGIKEFTEETDLVKLPRRLVETGVVWRFRERNGLPYEAKKLEYEAILARYIRDANQRNTINFSEPGNTRHPWDVPVPDYIPVA